MLNAAGSAPAAPPPADPDPDRLFSPFDLAGRTLLVAVSGGGDSVALLLLAHELCRCRPDLRLVAATVDHGLRPDSAGEAAAVARLCRGLGIPHRTLRWTGDRPAAGLAEAARTARYRLLSEAARQAGAGLILAAHTADDQAETVLMRQARGGGRGLAGMAPATLLDASVWLVRPLLATRRAALRDLLRRRGTGWSEDPTNADTRFERPRVRAGLDEAAVAAAAALQHAAARHRVACGEAAADLLRRHASRPLRGLVRLDPGFLDRAGDEAAIYAFRLLIAACGGMPHLPDAARAAGLLARLAAGPCRAALSRTLAERRAGGLFLHREQRDLPAPQPGGAAGAWDGRYAVAGAPAAARIVPFGRAAAGRAGIGDLPARPARAALAAEPAVEAASAPLPLGIAPERSDAGAVAVPLVAPFAAFLPGFDLAPAEALAALFGAPPWPPSPCRRNVAEA